MPRLMDPDNPAPTHGELYANSMLVAEVIKVASKVDKKLLEWSLSQSEVYHVIEPLLDPTRYRAEARGHDAAMAVQRQVLKLINTIEEVRNPDA